jgi:hypothetical protein
MDPFNPETWKHQWEVFITAPYIIFPLIVVGLIIGWWIGSRLGGAGISGLNATIGNLNTRNEVLEERLRLAADRERDVREKMASLEREFQQWKAQVAADAPRETLAPLTGNVNSAFEQLKTANTALGAALRGEGNVDVNAEVIRPSRS